MKNAPTDGQGKRPSGWARELATFDAALRARAMAEKTRRAYGVDLQQLADWAARHGFDTAAGDARTLRRFARGLPERGLSASTSARNRAAIRSSCPPPEETARL